MATKDEKIGDAKQDAEGAKAAPKRTNEAGDPNRPGAGGAPTSGGPSAGGEATELDTPASGNVPTDERLDAERDAEGALDRGEQIPEYKRLTQREQELVKQGHSFAQAQDMALMEQQQRLAAGEKLEGSLTSRPPDRITTL